MESINTQNKRTTRTNYEIFNTTKRTNWNNKRRYSFLTQYKFI